MKSSYEKNNYGDVFYSIVRAYQPRVCVELGVLNGYSTFHIARALIKNKSGEFEAYDLFEDYAYNHGNEQEVRKLLHDADYDFVKLCRSDAFTVYKNYPDNYVHLLHVDLSNTGETLKKIMEQWDSKMVQGGIILFEGGSEERDKVDWMLKYNAPPIKAELETNAIIQEKYILGTYLKYPSLTMLMKKR